MAYGQIAAMIISKVKQKVGTLQEKKAEREPHVQDVMGIRLEKENQLMRLAKRSLKR